MNCIYLLLIVVMSMNSNVSLSENIRTNCADKLLRNVSLEKMHNSLIDLFVDRTSADTTLRNLMNDESMKKLLRYGNCLCLNDERTIKFHESTKLNCDVFDESRQIWIPDYVKLDDDLFIPRDDAQ